VVDADAVQPLAGSVTVIAYGPAADTVFVFVVTPPPQSYLTPAVVLDAVNVTLVTEQVKSAGGAMLISGTIMFCVTVVDAVAEQPLAGSVTVTEYEPVVFTDLVSVVIPPPQSYVTPVVVLEAVNVTSVTIQVSSDGGAIVTSGTVIF